MIKKGFYLEEIYVASITKRGKSWSYTVSNYVDGVNKQIKKGGFRTKREAEIAAAAIEAQKGEGSLKLNSAIPIATYFERWIKAYKANVHYNTQLRYQNSLKWVKVYFENTKINTLTALDYQEFLNWFGSTRSEESVKKLDSHIGACLRHAHDVGDIRYNITRGRKIQASHTGKHAHDKYIANHKDAQKLYSYLYHHLEDGFGLIHHLLLLALVTGLRFQELLGLTPNDFDFNDNTLDINKSWDYKQQSGFDKLKNEASYRKITVDPNIMIIFKELIGAITKPRLHEMIIFRSPHHPTDSFTNEGTNKALRKVLNELGIDPITVHGLRHTHASELLYAGVSIQYISKRLGHSDIQTTLNTYTHIVKELEAQNDAVTVQLFTP